MKSLDELREETEILADNHIDTDELVRIAGAIEQEVKEKYIELPKDANGEYIHVGDEMLHGDRNIKRSCRAIAGGEYVILVGSQFAVDAKELTHYHESTVEDVLREFTDAILEWAGESGTVAEVGTWSDVAAEYAAKLQLREEE